MIVHFIEPHPRIRIPAGRLRMAMKPVNIEGVNIVITNAEVLKDVPPEDMEASFEKPAVAASEATISFRSRDVAP